MQMSTPLKAATPVIVMAILAVIFKMPHDARSMQVRISTDTAGIVATAARDTSTPGTVPRPPMDSAVQVREDEPVERHSAPSGSTAWLSQPLPNSELLSHIPDEISPIPVPVEGLTDSTHLAVLGLNIETLAQFQLRVDRILQERAGLAAALTQDDAEHRYEQTRLHEVQYELKRIRESMSDNDYDSRLFASGKPNRVVISTDSADAISAIGLAPGDMIVSYNGLRVFDVFELQAMDNSENPEEMVRIDLIRAGEAIEVVVPRGILLRNLEIATQSVDPMP